MSAQSAVESSRAEDPAKPDIPDSRASLSKDRVKEQGTDNSSILMVSMVVIGAIAALIAVEYAAGADDGGNVTNGAGANPGFTVPPQSVVCCDSSGSCL